MKSQISDGRTIYAVQRCLAMVVLRKMPLLGTGQPLLHLSFQQDLHTCQPLLPLEQHACCQVWSPSKSSPSASSPILADTYKGNATGLRGQLPTSYMDTLHAAALDPNLLSLWFLRFPITCALLFIFYGFQHVSWAQAGFWLLLQGNKTLEHASSLPQASTAVSHCHLQVQCYLQLMGTLSPLGISSGVFKIWNQ